MRVINIDKYVDDCEEGEFVAWYFNFWNFYELLLFGILSFWDCFFMCSEC